MSTKNESKAIDFPMTRERYLSSWKIFRTISDENYITAKHIVCLDIWNDVNTILDIGCGDGLITKSIALNSPQAIKRVTLVDPDREMLEEAHLHLSEIALVQDIKTEVSMLENCIEKYINNTDLVLAVHLVYLISDDVFKLLIDSLPVGKKMVLVLDHEESIFTKLWTRTAPKYVRRSEKVRAILDGMSSDHSVNRTTITSKLVNPLQQRVDVKEALLSLMSYSDFSLMDESSKQFVEEAIQQHLVGRFIECKSACYELIKLNNT